MVARHPLLHDDISTLALPSETSKGSINGHERSGFGIQRHL